MNKVVSTEHNCSVFGVKAKAFDVVVSDSGRILNQEVIAVRTSKKGGEPVQVSVKLQFDDNCGNGHESFSITANVNVLRKGRYEFDRGGCVHEDIAKYFPEFTHLIKWHLCSIDGPMHYLANTLYFAGNRDSSGLSKGEPSRFEPFVRFGDTPALFRVKDGFLKFIKEAIDSKQTFSVEEIPYIETSQMTSSYKFSPKYTMAGYTKKWHECPFDSRAEAQAFADSLNQCKVELVEVPTAFSEGKARELDLARAAAIWPEATDDELSQERDELAKVLKARLPALMEDFKADMDAVGFVWPTAPSAKSA